MATVAITAVVGAPSHRRSIRISRGEPIAIALTLQQSAGVAHNGSGGRVRLLWRATGDPGTPVVDDVAGNESGVYALQIPTSATRYFQTLVEWWIVYVPASGATQIVTESSDVVVLPGTPSGGDGSADPSDEFVTSAQLTQSLAPLATEEWVTDQITEQIAALAPTVTITSPAAGTTRDEGAVSVTVTASPAPVNGTAVTLRNGATVLGSGTMTGGTATIALTLTAGSYSLVASVNLATSTAVAITVADQDPSVAITSPAGGSNTQASTVDVTLQVTHPSAAPGSLTVEVSLSESFSPLLTATHVSGTTWSVTGVSIPEGSTTIRARARDATPGGSVVLATPVAITRLPNYLRFTTTGTAFAPAIELANGATATWTVEETGATSTSVTPGLTFGSSATRHVRLAVSNWADIRTINLGFSNSDDQGRYQMGAGYNRAATPVTAVENLPLATGLVRFAAANGDLTGALDFTGLANLEFIECYGSDVESVTLTGCTSLIRLCMEANRLTSLNLNPVAANLRDLRAAIQQGGTLAFEAMTSPLTNLYHFCVRDQTVTGIPSAANLPAIEELWIWNTAQTGALTVSSGNATSVLVYDNDYTAITVTGESNLVALDASGNSLNSAAVDAVIDQVDDLNTTNGTLDLGSTSAPTAAGVTDASSLRGRGWTVTVDAAAGDGVLSDDFNRADGPVGNGWVSVNNAVAAITSNQLTRSDSGAYRALVNPALGSLPADYTVSMVVSHASTQSGFLWVVGRWLSGNGVRFGFAFDRNSVTCGQAIDYQTGDVTVTVTGGLPASWGVDQPHTLALQFVGTTAIFSIDGQEYGRATIATNNTTGTGYGVAGEGLGRLWDSIGTSL